MLMPHHHSQFQYNGIISETNRMDSASIIIIEIKSIVRIIEIIIPGLSGFTVVQSSIVMYDTQKRQKIRIRVIRFI